MTADLSDRRAEPVRWDPFPVLDDEETAEPARGTLAAMRRRSMGFLKASRRVED